MSSQQFQRQIFSVSLLKTISKSIGIIAICCLLSLLSSMLSQKLYAKTLDFSTRTVKLINSERVKQHLPALRENSDLNHAAKAHSLLMEKCGTTQDPQGCLQHQLTSLGEADLLQRIAATGYQPSAVAENIGWGFLSPEAEVAAWMKSPGHRENILNATYADIGCRYVSGTPGDYRSQWWTCDFGTSQNPTDNTNTPPLPTPTLTPTPHVSSPHKIQSTPTPSEVSSSHSVTYVSTSVNNNQDDLPYISQDASKPWWCFFLPQYAACR